MATRYCFTLKKAVTFEECYNCKLCEKWKATPYFPNFFKDDVIETSEKKLTKYNTEGTITIKKTRRII